MLDSIQFELAGPIRHRSLVSRLRSRFVKPLSSGGQPRGVERATENKSSRRIPWLLNKASATAGQAKRLLLAKTRFRRFFSLLLPCLEPTHDYILLFMHTNFLTSYLTVKKLKQKKTEYKRKQKTQRKRQEKKRIDKQEK